MVLRSINRVPRPAINTSPCSLDVIWMLATPNILITDDDAALRQALAEAFSRRGYIVTLAADGEHGLDIARRERIHVALLDYQMPRLTGLQMLAQVHLDRPDLPCILMSGAMDDAVRAEAERMHAYRVTSKPLRLRDIDGIVREAMSEVYGWAG